MVRLPLILLLFIAHLATLSAQNSRPLVEYNAKDSLEVVQLLAESSLQSPLDFARRLCGRPYVAHTLERGDEHLVVNLRGLDCATLVETASALAIARRQLDRNMRTMTALPENHRMHTPLRTTIGKPSAVPLKASGTATGIATAISRACTIFPSGLRTTSAGETSWK